MKIVRHLFSGLMLFAGFAGGVCATADAQTVVSPVTSEIIKCDKALLDRDGSELIARFLVQNKPEYNSYRGAVAGHTLNSGNADLKMISSQVATWLIFIDISDPSGRKNVIKTSAEVAARLVSLMSPDSEVHVMVAAGSQQVVARTDELQSLMTEGYGYEPVSTSGKYSFLLSRICDAKGIENNNTHIWVGLTRALKDEMPDNVKDIKRYLPRGVILISDGMDESRTTDEDFRMLVQTSKEMNIPVHTIAVPYKDNPTGRSGRKKGKGSTSDTDAHKGYAALQRLAVQTNGSYLTYEQVKNPDGGDAIGLLNGMLRKTSAMVMQLKTSLKDANGNIIPAGRSLKLILTEGREKTVAYMELPQEQLGLVVGDYALECLLELRNGLNEANKEQTVEKMLKIFKESLLPLTATDKLFEGTYMDRDYALRVRKLLQHVKNTPGVLSKPGVDAEIAICLVDLNAPLPEPPKEDTNVNVNNNIPNQGGNVTINGTTLGSSEEEVADTPNLVWWVVGIGGAFACIIVFIIIIRSLSRNDEDDAPAVRGPRPDSGAAPVPTPPLATLDDAKQPGQCWAVRKTSVSVGRSASADVRLPSGHVSNIHFTLYREATGQWMIKDANSTNGTIVNGSKISTATALNSGDIISVADMQLVFRIK